jgi:hypothetical protein
MIKNAAELLESADNETVLKDLGMAKMHRCRIRYFTAGAVIGSRAFVNEAFAGALRCEAEGWGEEDAGKWSVGGEWALEHAGSAERGGTGRLVDFTRLGVRAKDPTER